MPTNEQCNIFENPEVKKFLFQFELFLKEQINKFHYLPFKGHKKLRQTMEYSLFSGGKYFRPLLVFATAQLFSLKNQTILPWAATIEMIHTASLIHDDLPCMDNSFERRRKATTHRRFGESMALLAGDCFWIEAFRLISNYGNNKNTKAWLSILCQATGFNGLMGGQALDLNTPINPSENYYKEMHFMKTGALITSAMEGVLALQDKTTEKTYKIKEAAQYIGRAFQLSDDLQDETETSKSNFINTFGKARAQAVLQELSNKALSLVDFKEKGCSHFLKQLIIFNRDR